MWLAPSSARDAEPDPLAFAASRAAEGCRIALTPDSQAVLTLLVERKG